MNGISWVSIISLLGMFVLAFSAFRAHHIGAKQTLVMALTWAAIFAAAGLLFSLFGT